MSTTGAIEPREPSRLWGWVRGQTRSLSGLRDLILVAAGACYGVGYLVWSVHAWHRNLGLLPALRFQYLIAGAIPILFVLAVYGFLWGLLRLRHRIAAWVGGPGRVRRLVHRGLGLLLLASFVAFAVTSFDWVEALDWSWLNALRAGALVAILVIGFVIPPPTKQGAILHIVRGFIVGYVVLAVGIGALAGLAWFTLEAYPRIPQELGGVQPRRAVVYLSPESRVAAEVLAALKREGTRGSDEIEPDARDPEGESALPRTTQPEEPDGPLTPAMIEVDVYFADSNVLLVKPVGEEQPFRSPTYEIRRQGVAATSWQ